MYTAYLEYDTFSKNETEDVWTVFWFVFRLAIKFKYHKLLHSHTFTKSHLKRLRKQPYFSNHLYLFNRWPLL